jgi:HEAT repeat protein
MPGKPSAICWTASTDRCDSVRHAAVETLAGGDTPQLTAALMDRLTDPTTPSNTC